VWSKTPLRVRPVTLAAVVAVAALCLAGIGGWWVRGEGPDLEAVHPRVAQPKAARSRSQRRSEVERAGSLEAVHPERSEAAAAAERSRGRPPSSRREPCPASTLQTRSPLPRQRRSSRARPRRLSSARSRARFPPQAT
jgi:hypothetical protein